MRLFANFLWVTVFCFFVGCNQVDDIQPADTEQVPVTAIQAIKTRYPYAEDILFKTLVTSKLWKVNFKSKNDAYETQVNETAITAAVLRKAGADFSFYKGLTDRLAIKGGVFSDLKVDDNDNGLHSAFMSYRLNGKGYQLHYRLAGSSHQITLLSDFSSYYVLPETDVPAKIKKFFSDHSVLMTDYGVFVIVGMDGQKTYGVYYKPGWTGFATPSSNLYFDKNGDLMWSAYNSDGSPVVHKTNGDLGFSQLLEKTGKDLKDFDQNLTGAIYTLFNGLQSIQYAFAKGVYGSDSSILTMESWYLLLNPMSEKVIVETYEGFIYQ
jgi:hypothetical protein